MAEVVGTWAAEETVGPGGSQHITVHTPPGVGTGTSLLVFVSSAHDADPADFEAPSGEWTQLGVTPAWTDTTDSPVAVVWLRLPRASLPDDTYEFRHDYTEITCATCLAIDGVDPDDPLDVGVVWDEDEASGDTMPAASVTTTVDGALLINVYAASPSASGSEDDQFTGAPAEADGSVATATTNFQSQMVAWETRASAGSTGTRTATFDDSGPGAGPPATYGSLALAGLQGTGAPQTLTIPTIFASTQVGPITLSAPAVEVVRTTPATLAERTELLEATHVDYDLFQVLVLDERGDRQRDIARQVLGCVIVHDGFRTIHRTIDLTTTAELDWGRERVQPWVRITGADWVDEVPLGVFAMTAPGLTGGRKPPLFQVQGYDLLYLVDQHLQRPVSLPADAPILGSVADLLVQAGFGTVALDASRASDVLSAARSWPVDAGVVTYLSVINDLLAMVGYQPLFVDADGVPSSAPLPAPERRRVAWRYDSTGPVAGEQTMVRAEGQARPDDYTDRYNHWYFFMNAHDREVPLTTDDGIFTYTNDTDGRSSVQARGGLVVSRVEGLEAATHDDLVQQAFRLIAEDIHAATTVDWTTKLNPYHGHRDVLRLVAADLNVSGLVEHTVWTHDVIARTTTHQARTLRLGAVAA